MRHRVVKGIRIMVKIERETADQNQLATVLGNAVSFVKNEALVLARYEVALEGKFANRGPGGENGEFNKRVNQVVKPLGGPPDAYLLRKDQEPRPADNY